MGNSELEEIESTQMNILKFAKSNGFLSPMWLLSNPPARRVTKAFEDLETFLRDSFLEGEIPDVTLDDVEDFIWGLKKSYAFDGWEGIAPFLLSNAFKKQSPQIRTNN